MEWVSSEDWDRIIITEQLELKPHVETVLNNGDYWESTVCKDRFQKLVTKGYEWINMQVLGVLNKNLLIDFSWPNSKPGKIVVASVNLSGPNRWLQERGCLLDDLLLMG